MTEIAAFCEVSVDTLERRFADAVKKGHELRNQALRTKQFQKAMAGSDKMLIWLGKQHLGQSDKIDNRNSDLKLDPGTLPVSNEFTQSGTPDKPN